MANQTGTGFCIVREISCSMKVTVQQVSKCGGLSEPRALHLTLITASNWSGIFGARISQVTLKCNNAVTVTEDNCLVLRAVWLTSELWQVLTMQLTVSGTSLNDYIKKHIIVFACRQVRAWHDRETKATEKGQVCHIALHLQGCRQSM